MEASGQTYQALAENANRAGLQANKEGHVAEALEHFKEAARLVIEASVRLKSLAGERALKLSRALFELSRDYANREEFRRNRSKLRAAERAMSKQRVSGSVMDEVFMSLASREVAEHFRRKDRPPTPTPREEPPSGGER